ncbi:MAG: hypothetical protein IJN69_01495 [Oscillospiraceae bacterium]|nr:hypothetical protein [Oscillospiraceae bacterium]
MKNKDYSYLYANWDDTVRRRKITLSNPVFVKGLALAPVVVAGTTVQNGILLCIAVFFLLTPTRIITSLITRHMSVPFKTFFYPFVSALVFAFVYYYMYRYLGTRVLLLGVYLPILVIDPLIVKNFEKTRKESVLYSVINGLRNTMGFVVACLLVCAVREFLAFGTIAGIKVIGVALLPMAQYSFGGFLIVALLSGIWSTAIRNYKYKVKVEAMHSERLS